MYGGYHYANDEPTHQRLPVHEKPAPPHGYEPHHVLWDHNNEIWYVNGVDDNPELALYYDPDENSWASLGKLGSKIGAGAAKFGEKAAAVGKAAYKAAPSAA